MLGYLTNLKHKESHGWLSLNDPLGARNPVQDPTSAFSLRPAKSVISKKTGEKKTERARFPLVGLFASLVAILQSAMDCRIAFRLPILVATSRLVGGVIRVVLLRDEDRWVACWNLNQWIFTLVEWCAWEQPQATLSDRSERSWDNPNRRPSHADRRRWIAHQCLENELSSVLGAPPDSKKFRALAESLFRICL